MPSLVLESGSFVKLDFDINYFDHTGKLYCVLNLQ